MNTPQTRRALAEQVAAHYARHPKVASIALAGSVARGWEDRHSDIELDVYWSEPPTEQDRAGLIAQAGGLVDVFWERPPADEEYQRIFIERGGNVSQLWPYEDGEWSEHYYVNGVNIGISGLAVESIDGYIDDVLLRHDTDDEKHIRMAAIQNAQPFSGVELLQGWKARIADYPRELAVALINEQLAYDDKWWGVDVWVDRGAHIVLAGLLHHMQIKVMRILLALNRIYLPDPRFKWTHRLIPQLRISPPNLEQRLRDMFALAPVDAARAMDGLISELLPLVSQELPEIDVSFAARWYRHRRPVNEW